MHVENVWSSTLHFPIGNGKRCHFAQKSSLAINEIYCLKHMRMYEAFLGGAANGCAVNGGCGGITYNMDLPFIHTDLSGCGDGSGVAQH